ncbi:MAG: hypothetical protein WAW63_00160 [Candidatus Saccharimonadales bacterium]
MANENGHGSIGVKPWDPCAGAPGTSPAETSVAHSVVVGSDDGEVAPVNHELLGTAGVQGHPDEEIIGEGDPSEALGTDSGSYRTRRSDRHNGNGDFATTSGTLAGRFVAAFKEALIADRSGYTSPLSGAGTTPGSTTDVVAVGGTLVPLADGNVSTLSSGESNTGPAGGELGRLQRRRRLQDQKLDDVPVADPEDWRRHAAAGAARTVLDVMGWQIKSSPVGPYLPFRAGQLAEGFFSAHFQDEVRGVKVRHQEDRPNAHQHATNEAMRLLKKRAEQVGIGATLFEGVSQVEAVRIAVDNLNNTPTAKELGLRLSVMQLVTDGTTSDTATCYVDAHAAAKIIQGETNRPGGLVQGRADYGVELTRPEGNVSTALHHTVLRIPDQDDRDRVIVAGLSVAYLPTPILPPGAEADSTNQGLFEITAVPLRRGTDNDSIIALLNSGVGVTRQYTDAAGTFEQRVTSHRQDLPRAVSWLADLSVLGQPARELQGAPIEAINSIVDAEILED